MRPLLVLLVGASLLLLLVGALLLLVGASFSLLLVGASLLVGAALVPLFPVVVVAPTTALFVSSSPPGAPLLAVASA